MLGDGHYFAVRSGLDNVFGGGIGGGIRSGCCRLLQNVSMAEVPIRLWRTVEVELDVVEALEEEEALEEDVLA